MEEMQGIMTLPQGGAAPQPTADPQQEALFEALRQQVPPKEFADQLLGAAAQADPQAVDAFVKELQALEVPLETLMLLNEMVDAILANPQDYARLRRQYMEQGVTKDVLPERFDPMFFAALNMALDQMTMKQPSPMGMAGGGIADLAQYGRHGDTMLAHINPQEAAMLKRMGGAGTINPVTGLPEYGNIFSSIGKAIKKFAQSSIGRIVLPIALGFFVGPFAVKMLEATAGTAMAAGIQGFVGGAGASLLRGEKIGDAIKAGAMAGVTAGALQGATNAFGQSVTAGGTQAPIDTYVGGVKTLVSPDQAMPPALPTTDPFAVAPTTVMGSVATDSIPEMGFGSFDYRGPPQTFPVQQNAVPPGVDNAQFQYANRAGTLSSSVSPPGPQANAANSMYAEPGSAAFEATAKPLSDLMQSQQTAGFSTTPGVAPPPPPGTEPGLMAKAKGLFDEYLNPKTLGEVPQDVINKADQAYTDTLRRTGSEARALREYDRIIKAGTPGILSTYGPLAAAGLAATAALGGFKEKPAAVPQMPDMMDPKYARPLQFGGIYGSRGYSNRPRMPVTAADGGIMALEMGGTTYPRKQGHIKGPGTGTSDSIPALLSDGEFVFTAKSVRNLGNGSRRKGAKRLYAMMKMLEERKV